MARQPEIPVRVTADNSRFQRGLRVAESDAERFKRRVASGAMAMRGWALAASVAGAAGAAFVRSAISAADSIDKASRAANIGAERLQTLRFAAEQSGISTEKMDGALAKFNVTLGRVTSGMETSSSSVVKAFGQLGLSVDELSNSGLTTEETLDLVYSRLADIKDGAEQASIAAQLFGRSAGPEMRNLLVNGVAGIQALETEARNSGGVIEEALIGRGVEIADKWNSIMNSMVIGAQSFALRAATAIDNAFGFTESGKIELINNEIQEHADSLSNLEEREAELQAAIRNRQRLQSDNSIGGILMRSDPRILSGAAESFTDPADEFKMAEFRGRQQEIMAEMNERNAELLKIARDREERAARLSRLTTGDGEIPLGDLPATNSGATPTTGGATVPDTDTETGTGGGTGGGADKPAFDLSELAAQWKARIDLLRGFQNEERSLTDEARASGLMAEDAYQASLAARWQARVDTLRGFQGEEMQALAEQRAAGIVGEEEFNARMAEIRAAFLENLRDFKANEFAILQEARAQGLLAEEEYQKRLTELAKKHAAERGEVTRLEQLAKINTTLGAGEEILSAVGAFNDRALRMAKIAGAAQAFVSTLQAQANTLATTPFPANLKAAALVGAKGLAFVAAIKGVGGGGGGGGAVGGGIGAAVAQAAPRPLEARISGIDPNSLYTGEAISTIFTALQKEAGDRGLRTVFAA